MTDRNDPPAAEAGRSPLKTAVDDGVLRVVIDRAEKRNALSRAVLAEIGAAFSRHAADRDLRFAVLSGAGDKSFAAGGDLKDLQAVRGAEAAADMARAAKAALMTIRRFPVPVVAALNGAALGGGAELAMACDMRVAVRHATIGFIQGRLAISTAWGGGVDLVRLLGPARALELLCRAEVLEAPRAEALGLVNLCGEEGEDAEALVDRFTAPMVRQAPQVMRAFKALSRTAHNAARAAEDDLETEHFAGTWAHPDHDAAVERLFARRQT